MNKLVEDLVSRFLTAGKTQEEILSHIEVEVPEDYKVSLKQKIQTLMIELGQLQEIAEGNGQAFAEFALSDPSQRNEVLSMLESNLHEVAADVRRAAGKVPRMTEDELDEYLETRKTSGIESPGIMDLLKYVDEQGMAFGEIEEEEEAISGLEPATVEQEA